MKAIINLGNQAVLVPFYVKYSPFLNGVGGDKSLAYIGQTLPKRLFGNAKPGIQRWFKLGMPQYCFFQFLAADYMHRIGLVRIMRIS